MKTLRVILFLAAAFLILTNDAAFAKPKFAFGDKHGITYEIFKVPLNLEDQQENMNFTYSIEFPSLTEAQFQLLASHFRKQTPLRWKARTRYTLLDFLPPKMQAFALHTMRHDYHRLDVPPEWGGRPGMDGFYEYSTGINCWDFAYEVMRDFYQPFVPGVSQVRFAHIGAPIMDAVMKNPANSNPAGKKEISFKAILPGPEGASERNSGRQLGDVFMLNTFVDWGQSATHVMIWLDDDFYIEKTNQGSFDPVRIITYDDAVSPWLNEMVIDTDHRHALHGTFYRYDRGLPDQFKFTGRDHYYNWQTNQPNSAAPKTPLDPEIARTYIWNLDVGLGGGLSVYSINPVRAKVMVLENDRAKFANACDWMLKTVLL